MHTAKVWQRGGGGAGREQMQKQPHTRTHTHTGSAELTNQMHSEGAHHGPSDIIMHTMILEPALTYG